MHPSGSRGAVVSRHRPTKGFGSGIGDSLGGIVPTDGPPTMDASSYRLLTLLMIMAEYWHSSA
jgi:hypothetical protein